MTGYRVALSNGVLLNGGDAAIVEATIEALRAELGPGTTFHVADAAPETTARLHPHLDVLPWPWHAFVSSRGGRRLRTARRRLAVARAVAIAALAGRGCGFAVRWLLSDAERRVLDAYTSADLIISKGGTYLVENYNLAPYLFDFRITRLLRRPLVLYTQSLGPFTDERARRRLARVFERAVVMVRDERSREHVRELGVAGERVRVFGDAAFAFARPPAPRDRREGLRVAVSVREWPHFRSCPPAEGMARYLSAVREMVVHLVERRGAEVTFLSTCQGVPEYKWEDSAVARRLVGSLPPRVAAHVEVDPAFHTTSQLRSKLAGFDLAISTRMHFAILALGCGVPVLPIAYEFKTTELFGRLGMGEHVQDIETIEPRSAVGALEAFLQALPGRRDELFEGVATLREEALDAARHVARLLGPSRDAAGRRTGLPAPLAEVER